MLDAEFSRDTTAELAGEALRQACRCAPVYDVAPGARQSLRRASAAACAIFRIRMEKRRSLIANPIRLSDAELPRRAAPALGADTDALLRSLGYGEERIAALRAARAVG